MSSCWRRIYGYRRCLLVGKQYIATRDVFVLQNNLTICKMSSCWRRLYGLARCLLVGEECMAMEDVFLLEKNIWLWKMSSCWRRVYGNGRYLIVFYLILFYLMWFLFHYPVCCAVDADLRDQGVRRRGLMVDSKSSG